MYDLWPKEKTEEMFRLRAQKLSYAEIAKRLNTTVAAIANKVRRHQEYKLGLRKKKELFWTDERDAVLRGLWEQKLSAQQIAFKMNLSEDSVKRRATRLALPPRVDRYGWPDEVIEVLKQLWNTGLTTREIADKIGVSKGMVIGKARRLKLPPRISGGGKPNVKKSDQYKSERVIKERVIHKHPSITAVPKTPTSRPNAIQAWKLNPVVPTTGPEATTNPRPEHFLGVAFDDLTPRQCRYPHGGDNGVPITFCGQPAKLGSSYCPACHSICWKPIQRRTHSHGRNT